MFLKLLVVMAMFQDYKDKIFSYSDQAIKILTNKDLQYEEVLGILENDIYKVKEIKKLLLPAIEKNKMEFLPDGQKFFNFNKIEKLFLSNYDMIIVPKRQYTGGFAHDFLFFW